MIRVLWKILALLLLIILCAASCVGVMAFMPTMVGRFFHINDMGRRLIELWRPHHGLFLLWAACFVGTIVTFISAILSSINRPTHIEVQLGGGRIVILDSAIRKYIKTALTDLPDVVSRKITMRQTRHGLLVDIHADVRTKDRLPDLERKVIARVRAALAEDLGITGIAGVHVYIKDIEVGSKPELIRRVSPPRESQFQLREPAPAKEIKSDPFDRPWNPPVASGISAPVSASIEKISMIQTSRPADEPPAAISIVPMEEPKPAEPESIPNMESATTIIDPSEKRRGFFSRWKKDKPEQAPAAPTTENEEPVTGDDPTPAVELDLDHLDAPKEKPPEVADPLEKKDLS